MGAEMRFVKLASFALLSSLCTVACAQDNLKPPPSLAWCEAPVVADFDASMILPDAMVNIVDPGSQSLAIRRLKDKKIVKIDRKSAEKILRRKIDFKIESEIILTRAALYGGDENYNLPKIAFRTSPFNVLYDKRSRMLHVNSTTMGRGDIPERPVAIVVELPSIPRESNVTCSSIQ